MMITLIITIMQIELKKLTIDHIINHDFIKDGENQTAFTFCEIKQFFSKKTSFCFILCDFIFYYFISYYCIFIT